MAFYALLAASTMILSQSHGSPIQAGSNVITGARVRRASSLNWNRLGEGCCRLADGSGGHPDVHSRISSANECKQLCLKKTSCVAVEYNSQKKICEIHKTIPTQNSSLSSGCAAEHTKCLRVSCWIEQSDDSVPVSDNGNPLPSGTFTNTSDRCGSLCYLDPNVLGYSEVPVDEGLRTCTCYTRTLLSKIYDRSIWANHMLGGSDIGIDSWKVQKNPSTVKSFELSYGTYCSLTAR